MPKTTCDFKPNSSFLVDSRYNPEDPENITVEQLVEKESVTVGEDQYYTCTWTAKWRLNLTCTYHLDGTLLKTIETSPVFLHKTTKLVRKAVKSASEPTNPDFDSEDYTIISTNNTYTSLLPFCTPDCPPPELPHRNLRLGNKKSKDPRVRPSPSY